MNKALTLYFSGTMLFYACVATAFSCSKNDSAKQVIPGDTTATKRDMEVWITRSDRSALLAHQDKALEFGTTTNQYPTITVDTTQSYQTMDGFGFALTGGSAYLINHLPGAQRDSLIKELFSPGNGCIDISYIRISIGSSDLDASVFSYDDLSTGQQDTALINFSLDHDRADLIPVIKTALVYNPELRIIGSPWSAPAWMKSNNSSKGGSLMTQYYDVYAKYLVKYIQGMKSAGISIDAITPQNEPLNPDNNPSMVMTSDQEKEFIKNNLGPAFHNASLNTKIIIYDHNCDHPEYATNILADPQARQYIDGSAFHLYAGNITALTQTHLAFPDKNVYFTEQWIGGPSNFGSDLQWSVKNLVIGAPRNWSRNVLEWNLANGPDYKPHTDGGCTSCEGALTVSSSVIRNVSYYIIAHASKFVPAGSVRIGSNAVTNLSNVAFKTPSGKKILIVLNESTSTQSFNIKFGNRQVTANLDPGVATYIW